MKKIVMAAVGAATVFGCVSSAMANDAVLVEGNRHVDAEVIRGFFVARDANEALKNLYATGMFKDVKVLRRGRAMVVRVVENDARIGRVVFLRNSKIKQEQLDSEVKSRADGPYDQSVVDADIRRLGDVYRRAGRAAAKVSALTGGPRR